MSRRSILFLSLFSVTAIIAVALPLYAANAALVPCGTTENPVMCTFCDFFVLLQNVMNFLLVDVMTPVGVLLIVVGGVMIMTSGAKPANYAQGKKIIEDTIIGIFVILSAWMITNTIMQLFVGDNNISTHWYTISCTPSTGGGGLNTGGSTPTPAPGGSSTPTPASSGGQSLSCPNWKSLVKPVNGVTWERCTGRGGGTCPDCVKVVGDNGSSTQYGYARKKLADYLNNDFAPALRAVGITDPYPNQDGVCTKFAHKSCTHFNGESMDISTKSDPARARKICAILNEAKAAGKISGYILETPPSGSPCPAVDPQGSGIHINM